MRRLRHGDDGHHHRRDHRVSHAERQDASGTAFATLKLKIEETFSSLTGAGDSNDDSAESTSSFEGEFQARFQFSGPDGEFKAKLKFSMDSDSAQSGTDFASALQGFAQTLFAALNALYGGSASPTTPTLPAPADGGASTPTLPTPAPTSASTSATAAVDATPVGATPPADTPPEVAPAPTAPPNPVTGGFATTTTSFSIKLRATYDSFENNLGPLANQLAQPNVGDAFPALTSLLNDLADRFGQLVSHSPAAGTSAPSLQDFLKALSGSFFGPKPAATTEPVAADPAPSATASADIAPAVTDPGLPETPLAADTTMQRYTAMAQYRQVLTYSDAASSFSLQTRLSARMVYEVA